MQASYACSIPDPAISDQLLDLQISPGAGSTFRRQALLDVLDQGYSFVNDTTRHGNLWITGEDTELCYVFAVLGWKFLYDEHLTLQHVMYPARLHWTYARKLSRTIGTAAVGIDPFLIFRSSQKGVLSKLRATWQWQALAKIKRLSRYGLAIFNLKQTEAGEGDFQVIRMERDYGALQRILKMRGAYSQHLRLVREFISQHTRMESAQGAGETN